MIINLAEKLVRDDLLLKNKVAVVTGARRGMGQSEALTLAKAGAKVVVSDISQDDCEEVVEKIKKGGGEAIAIKCDVSKKEEVEKLFEKTKSEFGPVDILVNNAGIVEFSPLSEKSESEWDKTIDINLKGQFLCAKEASKQMTENGGGSIVNIASVAMGQTGAGMATITDYCASKGGIAAMSQAMAAELAPQGIRVNVISPGMIETPMIEPIMQDEEQRKNTLSKIPMGRVGESQEIANLALFLASDASSYMTGSIIIADGGWTATL